MKKNTLLYIIIFVILGSIAAWLLVSQSNTTLNVNAQDFAIEDTAAIQTIKLTDKQGNISTLEKSSAGGWMVNNKYKAEESLVNTLLETMRLVQVKSPVPLSARDNVIKIMASTAAKVEAFDKKNNLIKSYYVGGTTPDELGTFMLMENASEPFITHIPGFFGYLSSRYITKSRDWRSTEIYAFSPAVIQNVNIVYHAVPEASFNLRILDNDYILKSEQTGTETKISSLRARQFLAGFRHIVFEQFPELSAQKKDSILASPPLITINVIGKGIAPPQLVLYTKQADVRTKGLGPNDADLDKFYGVIEKGSREIVLIQSDVAAKILPSYQDLLK